MSGQDWVFAKLDAERDGMSTAERSEFNNILIGALAASDVDPEVWQKCIDIATKNTATQNAHAEAGQAADKVKVSSRRALGVDRFLITQLCESGRSFRAAFTPLKDNRSRRSYAVAYPVFYTVHIVETDAAGLELGERLIERLHDRISGFNAQKVFDSVEAQDSHHSSPSVGAPSGAVCDNPKPTDGELNSAAVTPAQWGQAS